MENTQKVRHIPIFVEGRDEPIINRDHNQSSASTQNSSSTGSSSATAESSAKPQNQNQFFSQNPNFGRAPPMNFSDMGNFDNMANFGDIPMPHGSIFERAKEFPVRDFFNVHSTSPRRSESPIHVTHHQAPHTEQQETKQRASTPQPQQTPPQPKPEEPKSNPNAAKQKALEDSITKIQKIQQSVLELMVQVEKYDGVDNKEYLYLDEMLTQNLLKLDDIDAEGKDNIKSARREAIKCINSLISLLEAKKEEAAGKKTDNSETKDNEKEAHEAPPQNEMNGSASKNSSYDNINNNNNNKNEVKQTGSTSSVTMNEVPEKSAEASLEEKVANAIQKQNEQKQS